MKALTCVFDSSRFYFFKGPKPRQYNKDYMCFGIKDIYSGYGMGLGKGFTVQVSQESISLWRNNKNVFGALGNQVFEIKRPGLAIRRFCIKRGILKAKEI